jgi:hypothetical protein
MYIRQLYDAFGPERLFWGTDITRIPYSWRQCVTMFTEELPWLSASDKELIMARLAVAGVKAWHVSPVPTPVPTAGGAALSRTRAIKRPSQQEELSYGVTIWSVRPYRTGSGPHP